MAAMLIFQVKWSTGVLAILAMMTKFAGDVEF